MENLTFCLNATIPIFLTLMLGYFFRKINLYNDSFVSQLNKFVFKAALPALLFLNVAESDFTEAARQSSALPLSRIFTEMLVWHPL